MKKIKPRNKTKKQKTNIVRREEMTLLFFVYFIILTSTYSKSLLKALKT